jgi:hypothetical protein
MAKGSAKKAAKKSASRPARKGAAKHPELGRGARFLRSAAAGYASGTIVAHDGREASIELAGGDVVRRQVGEYELTRAGARQKGD